MTTLAVVSTATQVIGEIQSAKTQTRAIDQQLATQQQQIASQQVAELNDRQRQARREQARIKVAAGQAGLNISGSVTDLLNDSVMQNALAAAIERARTGGVRSLTIPRGASGSASVAPTTPRSPTIPAPSTGGGSSTADPAMSLLAKLPGTTGSLARKALSKAK